VKGKEYQEIFYTMLKEAKIKSYAENKLTLEFESDYKAGHFEHYYKVRFENTASKLFGKQIEVIAEWSK